MITVSKYIGNRGYLFFVFFALFISIDANTQSNKTLRVAIDDSCPYSCLEFYGKGIFIDVLEAVVPQGYQLDYVQRPWKRAIYEFGSGGIDILPAAAALAFPNGLNTQSILADSICFYSLKELEINYRGVDYLSDYKIGWLQFDHKISPGEPIYEFSSKSHQLDVYVFPPSVDGSIDRGLQLLVSGRIDLLLFNRSIMRFHLLHAHDKTYGVPIKEVGCLRKSMPLGYAVANAHPDSEELFRKLDANLLKFKATAAYSALINKYLGDDFIQ